MILLELEQGEGNNEMKKVKRTFFFVIAVAVLSIVYLNRKLIKRPSQQQDFQATKPGKWNKVRLSNKTAATDGSKYFLYTRKGESRNLMIYFSGGGACWDGETANVPLSLRSYLKHGQFGYYFARIPFYVLSMHQGIFEQRPDNPFSDWNVVFIPYASGDFHIGNTSTDYPRTGSARPRHVKHNGRNNVQEALQWIYRNFDTPDKLLITGSSAGGFGSAFWASEIANHYAQAEIYHLSDSSFLASDNWSAIVNQNWQANFQQQFSYPMEADMIASAFLANGTKMPTRAVLMHACTTNDKVLASFQNRLNGKGDEVDQQSSEEWSRQFRASTRKLDEQMPNFYYFLTDYGYDEKTHTTPHTLLPMKAFYEAEEDGKKLFAWLDGIIHKNERVSQGARFLQSGETVPRS